jgi:hypothetical protein
METEAWACMEGVALALQWSRDPTIIETDNGVFGSRDPTSRKTTPNWAT